jgi:hypothetical protein
VHFSIGEYIFLSERPQGPVFCKISLSIEKLKRHENIAYFNWDHPAAVQLQRQCFTPSHALHEAQDRWRTKAGACH